MINLRSFSRQTLKGMRSGLAQLVGTLRCRAFDLRHGVDTCGVVSLRGLTIRGEHALYGINYDPTPPRAIRYLLREINVAFSETTFIDMGSGKGRALLVAAEYPFKAVIGVEFAEELHNIAVNNIRAYRGKLRCQQVRSVNTDATEFSFPCGPLVVHFFNPFQPPVLERVLTKIIACRDRPIVLAFQAMDWMNVVKSVGGLTSVRSLRYFDIYEVAPTFANRK